MNERPVIERLKVVAEMVRSYYGVSEQEFYCVGCRTQEATEALRRRACVCWEGAERNMPTDWKGPPGRVAQNLIYKAKEPVSNPDGGGVRVKVCGLCTWVVHRRSPLPRPVRSDHRPKSLSARARRAHHKTFCHDAGMSQAVGRRIAKTTEDFEGGGVLEWWRANHLAL